MALTPGASDAANTPKNGPSARPGEGDVIRKRLLPSLENLRRLVPFFSGSDFCYAGPLHVWIESTWGGDPRGVRNIRLHVPRSPWPMTIP